MINIFKKLFNNFSFIYSRTYLIVNEFNLDNSYRYVWGMKSSGQKYRNKKSNAKNLNIIYLEDGFIHSFGTKKPKIPLSICFDNKGIYYNYKIKSDFSKLISEKLSEEENSRSKTIIKLWRERGISKYNFSNFLMPPNDPFILLIDQTLGDLSIEFGGANLNTFNRMFEFAKSKWPDHIIVIKIHPDVINKRKRGCFDKKLYTNKNVKIISDLGQLNKLIEFCTALCVVTSQVGFEGLIYGKEVHVFGNPFYSGIGLTIDHGLSEGMKTKSDISIEQLVFGALVKYQIYLDPRNKKNCEIEKIIEYIYKKRNISNFFPENLYCLNLTPWKSRQIKRYLSEIDHSKVYPFKKYKRSMKNILVWGKSIQSDKLRAKTKNFISVEDGFIRSVGLGGDLIPPMSLLFDKKGIHYDPSKPSDIEELLQTKLLNKQDLNRSKSLIKEIKIKKISKYNLKSDRLLTQKNKLLKKEIILVLGQVETDNSIIYGVSNNSIKKTNFSLVSQVKKDYPDHYIIYKPHPDLEKGLRSKGSEEDLIKNIADDIVFEVDIEELFEISKRVAVFTSLGGFEALLRGIPVTSYGFPFYAGWGLTDDRFVNKSWAERRNRNLSLEELVFISMIVYPYYFSMKFNCHTEIENIVDELNLYKNNKKNIEQIIFRYWGPFKDFLKKKGFFI